MGNGTVYTHRRRGNAGRRILLDLTPDQIEAVRRRHTWPVALLAAVCGCSRMSIYRMVQAGTLSYVRDAGRVKIVTASVIREHKRILDSYLHGA